MHRAAPPRFASCGSSFVALCLAAALPAQSDRLRPVVDRALVDLADPNLATDAARRLRNLGPGAVAPLCEALSDANRAQIEVRVVVVDLLGRLGNLAVPALPTLRALMGGDEALAEPAAAAIGRIVPFLADEACQAIAGDLSDAALARRYDNGFVQLRAALQLGPQPSEAQLRRALDGGHLTVAAARWIAARGETLREGRDELGAAVEVLIEPLLVRPAIRWRTGATPWAPELATAQLALTNAPLDALTARALLEHQDADERRRAIGWLAENGAALPMRQRADLVGRLWDSDRAIVIAAAEAAGRWGLAGMVALPALRLTQASHEDAAVAAACRTAADRILNAGDRLPANDRAWLAALDAALRGDPAAAPARPCSRAGLELLGEMLYLAQWNDATSLSRVLSLFESAGPAPKDAIRAVFGWLPHENPRVADLACAWLTRRGLAAREAFGMGEGTGETDFAVFLRRACRYSMHHQAVRSGIEMLAHLLADGVWDANGAMLLDDVNSRVVAHALATAIAESRGTLRSEVRRLQTLLEAPNTRTMRLDDAAWDPRGLPVDLGNHVRTLAAIALSDLGVEFTAPPDLDDVVRQTIGIPIVDLRKHVEGLRESNRLPALLDRIEDQCRLMLCVPPHLRWPSLGGTTR